MEDQIEQIETQEEGIEPEQGQLDTESSETLDWTQDKRYENWGKDPNKLYKSYRDIEKAYSPLKSKYTELEQKLSEYEDPNNEKNIVYNYLSYLSNHPEYSAKLNALIEEVGRENEVSKYGREQTAEERQMRQELEELKSFRQQIETETFKKELDQSIDKNLDEVKSLADEYGIEYSEAELINYVTENNLGIDGLKRAFLEHALPAIARAQKARGEESVVRNLSKNRQKAGVSGKSVGGVKKPTTFEDEADAIVNKMFNYV